MLGNQLEKLNQKLSLFTPAISINMSQLLNAINRLMVWHHQHMPDYAASFLPGLSHRQIQEISHRLDCWFPDELYELYQWSNGTQHEAADLVLPAFRLTPLEHITKVYEKYREFDAEDYTFFSFLDGRKLFPIVEDQGAYLCIVLPSQPNQESSAIATMGSAGASPTLVFDSITSMMLTLAESYEAGIYFIDAEGYLDHSEFREKDYCKILRKYNPEILKNALEDIKILSTDFEISHEKSEKIFYDLQILMDYQAAEAIDFLLSIVGRYPKIEPAGEPLTSNSTEWTDEQWHTLEAGLALPINILRKDSIRGNIDHALSQLMVMSQNQ